MKLLGRIVTVESHNTSHPDPTFSLELHVARNDIRLFRITQEQFDEVKARGFGKVELEVNPNSGLVLSITRT